MFKLKQASNISSFKKHLEKNGYSQNVIRAYIRHVKQFWECHNIYLASHEKHDELKKSITEYVSQFPLSSRRNIIQAALHTNYYFISGHKFKKRLCIADFKKDELIELEVERFRNYLNNVQGLREVTIHSYCSSIKSFLYASFKDCDFTIKTLTSKSVQTYLTTTLGHVSVASRKSIVNRIKSYFKFLEFVDGFQSNEILKLPMNTPVWKKSSIPKYLTAEDLNLLFGTYDKTSPIGIRNYAIARCFRDLGLRCSEVASLSLDDFDWNQGTIKIRKTKSQSERTLPLLSITGQAIESYLLSSRPDTKERTLFVRFKNEIGSPMGASQVRCTVRTAAQKAGLEHFCGTHMLRHTVAKEMLNNGTTLKTIADILGHDSIETTSIYTKLKFTELSEVSGVWPEVKL